VRRRTTEALAVGLAMTMVVGGLALAPRPSAAQAAPTGTSEPGATAEPVQPDEPDTAPDGPPEDAVPSSPEAAPPTTPSSVDGSRLFLTVSPPTGVSLQSDHLGLTVRGTPQCNVSNCRLLVSTSSQPLSSPGSEVPSGTSTWPSWWAQGASHTLYVHSWGNGWGWTKTNWNTSYTVTRPVTTPLTARVASTDHAGRSAVVTGTATRGARVEIGSRYTTANATTGAWTLTVTGLAVGANPLTVVQKIGTTVIGTSVRVTVTIDPQVVPGLVRQVDATPQALLRGGDTAVAVTVEFTERTQSAPGAVTFSAPAGTTFAAGQDTLSAQYRASASSTWEDAPAAASWGLVSGSRSADGSTYSFTFPGTGSALAAGGALRWAPRVSTPLDAPVGEPSLGFTMTGAMNSKLYDVAGSVSTPIVAATLTAEVVSVDAQGRVAVVRGTATPGATVAVGENGTAVAESDGTWSTEVEGLQLGENELAVTQTVGGVPVTP